jgi:hypothetical protein
MSNDISQLRREVRQMRQRGQIVEARSRLTPYGGANGEPIATSRVVVQTAHGFTDVGTPVRCSSADTYVKAQATTVAAAAVVGIVGQIINDNAFVLVTAGAVTGLTGLTAGAQYYLSGATAGAVVVTPPTISVPVYTAVSTEIAVINIGTPASPGFPAISFYNYLPGHGFVVGDVVYMAPSGHFALAMASNEDGANAVGIVSDVSGDYFSITVCGLAVGVFTGMTPGTRYWISQLTAGALNNAQPVAYGTQFCTSVNDTDVLVNPFQARRLAAMTGTPANQTGHGLSVGDVIYRNPSSGAFEKARANAAGTAKVIGVVVEVIDTANFVFASSGWLPLASSPYTAEAIYYLSDTTAGAVVTTPPADNIVQVFQAIFTDGIYIDVRALPSAADHIAFAVHQAGHGFVVGDILLNSGSGTYAKAKADGPTTARVVGVVSAVAGVDDFTYTMAGRVSGLTGRVANLIYYLSDVTSGAATVTPTTRYPVQVYEAISTTEVIVNIVPLESSVNFVVAQTGHGFVVGNILYLSAADTYAKAQASSATKSRVVGMVSQYIDANNFVLTTQGVVGGLVGLTAGSQYYLSPTTPGSFTTTDPVSYSVGCFVAINATTLIFDPRPFFENIPIDMSGLTFIASGSGTVTNSSTRRWLLVVGVGAGGGGDNSSTPSTLGYIAGFSGGSPTLRVYTADVAGGGSGGGAGGFFIALVEVGGADFSYSIGAGGSAGAGSATAGGDTTVTAGGATLTGGGGQPGTAGVGAGGGTGGPVSVSAAVSRLVMLRGADGSQTPERVSISTGSSSGEGGSSLWPFSGTVRGHGGRRAAGVSGAIGYKLFD